MAEKALGEGEAWEKFLEWIEAQGGSRKVVENPELLPKARYREPLLSPRSGYISELDAMEIGLVTVFLGGGREKKGEPIDYSVGIELEKKIGDYVEKGEPLLYIHANDQARLEQARQRLLGAFAFTEAEPPTPPLIYEVIR
jgi:pyrimidine-nucleoside phosphorylase